MTSFPVGSQITKVPDKGNLSYFPTQGFEPNPTDKQDNPSIRSAIWEYPNK